MPITNGKYINPGWVNLMPPAINAPELNDMSHVLETLTAPGGRRGGYVVVGTSTAGATVTTCDFLCDGTADDVEINAAIQKAQELNMDVLLLYGVYVLANPITPYFNMLIVGQNTGSHPTFPSSSIYTPNKSILSAQSESLSTLISPIGDGTACFVRLKNLSIGDGSSTFPSSLLDLSGSNIANVYMENVIMYTEGEIGIKMPVNSSYFFCVESTIPSTDFSNMTSSYFGNCTLSGVSFENCGSAIQDESNTFFSFNQFTSAVSLTDCARITFIGNTFEENLTLTAVADGAGNRICGLNNISSNIFANGSGITLGTNTRYNMVTNNGGLDYGGGSSFTPWAGVTDNGSNNYVANNMPT